MIIESTAVIATQELGPLIHNILSAFRKDVQSVMAWLPTKGSIRRHMIRQVGGSQAASWHKTPRARCTLSFPAASGRVSVSA